jgi:hypothetical protein
MKTFSVFFGPIIAVSLLCDLVHADNSTYYQNTANSILSSLQSKASQLDADETAALALLNSGSDMPTTSPSHGAAEELLANSFSSQFAQADDIDFQGYITGTPFEGSRDVYTFCPDGSEVKRPLTTDVSVESQGLEYVWGWSRCEAPDLSLVSDAIRIKQIWVSDVKSPILTLQMVDDNRPGTIANLEIDLDKLVSGNISVTQILTFISPR